MAFTKSPGLFAAGTGGPGCVRCSEELKTGLGHLYSWWTGSLRSPLVFGFQMSVVSPMYTVNTQPSPVRYRPLRFFLRTPAAVGATAVGLDRQPVRFGMAATADDDPPAADGGRSECQRLAAGDRAGLSDLDYDGFDAATAETAAFCLVKSW